MSDSTFGDFCASLCDLLGTSLPHLEPDASGVVGFTVEFRDVKVCIIEGTYGREPAMLMAVLFGVPTGENELEVLRGLLDANFHLSGMMAPAFVRNPSTGEISLHQSYLLSQADPVRIFRGIQSAAQAVPTWRENPVLGSAPTTDERPARVGASTFA